MRKPSLRNSPEYIIGDAVLKAARDPDQNIANWFLDDGVTSLFDELSYFLFLRLTQHRREALNKAGFSVAAPPSPTDPKSPRFDPMHVIGLAITRAYATTEDQALPAVLALLQSHMAPAAFAAVSEQLSAERAIAGTDSDIPF